MPSSDGSEIGDVVDLLKDIRDFTLPDGTLPFGTLDYYRIDNAITFLEQKAQEHGDFALRIKMLADA